jgi:hypothetical protein
VRCGTNWIIPELEFDLGNSILIEDLRLRGGVFGWRGVGETNRKIDRKTDGRRDEKTTRNRIRKTEREWKDKDEYK